MTRYFEAKATFTQPITLTNRDLSTILEGERDLILGVAEAWLENGNIIHENYKFEVVKVGKARQDQIELYDAFTKVISHINR